MVLLSGALIVGWWLLVRRFGEGDVYAVIGPYALGVTVLLTALRSGHMRRWMAPTLRSIGIGVGVGVVMTALTYPMFQLSSWLFPQLDADVQGLYRAARSTTLPKAMVWLIAAGLAEEVLFRGVLAHELTALLPERRAHLLGLAMYAAAQLGTGSLIVSLVAAVCGAIWTVQRVYTRSLLSPLISHLIWSPTVILLYPVT